MLEAFKNMHNSYFYYMSWDYMHTVSLSSPAHLNIPSHVYILSTMGLVMVIQGPLAPLLSSSCYIVCDSCICFMVLPLSWLRNHSKLGVSGLRFVDARFPYLFCVTFSLCTKILLCTGSYMYACDTYIARSLSSR